MRVVCRGPAVESLRPYTATTVAVFRHQPLYGMARGLCFQVAYGQGTSGSHSVVGVTVLHELSRPKRLWVEQAQQRGTDGHVSLLQVVAVVEGRFWSCGVEEGGKRGGQ
jgi:hypothetical protein